jgi:hypothetical protein
MPAPATFAFSYANTTGPGEVFPMTPALRMSYSPWNCRYYWNISLVVKIKISSRKEMNILRISTLQAAPYALKS